MIERDLRPLPKLSEKAVSFDFYCSCLEQLCDFLRSSEGVKTSLFAKGQREFVEQKFHEKSSDQISAKFAAFERFYSHCREVVAKGNSLRDKKKSLEAFKKKYRLVFPEEESLFNLIDDDVFIEIYNQDFLQVYRSLDFLDITNHGVAALEFCEWWDLFDRAQSITQKQLEIVQKLFGGQIKTPLYNPIDPHTVKEINSPEPLSSQAEVLAYSPIYNEDGGFEGGLHFFRVKSSFPLNFKIV